LLCLACLVVTSSGCAYTDGWWHNGLKVGPNYCRPAAPVADDWIDAYDQQLRAELPQEPAWWLAFNDPQLTQLIDDMYQQNLTVRSAGLRVLQARQQRAIAVGTLLPQFQESYGSYQRNLLSKEIVVGPPGAPRAFSQWDAGFNMVWELDVWGKFRRNIEAADATLDASVEQYDAILLSLLAETAATYVDIRTLQQRLRYAQSNVEIQQGSLRIAQTRFDNGATTQLDVTQATTSLQNTKETIPQFRLELRQATNRLCVLLGTPPREVLPELGEAPIPTPPPTVAVGIPANLIRRRPDVRAAERLVAAQSARIGVAAADLLPHFSISGAIGYAAEDLDDLFTSAASTGFLVPGFNWDVLNYGRLLNNVELQDARFQQLAIEYQQIVLEAGEETENAIVAYLESQQRLREVQGAVDAAQRSVELAIAQYRDGLTDFNRVFTLQDILVQQQDRLAAVHGQVARSLIALYKALGGGWEIRLTGGTPVQPVQPLPEPEALPLAPAPPNEMAFSPDA
jgi:NodT family efflux transporter outer membrane factor (OMF) lipoprotein